MCYDRLCGCEEILGRALKDFADRDDVVIATKLRHPMRPGPNGRGLSRKAIMTEVDHSLRRLGTASIHAWKFAKALHLQQRNGWARFVSMQNHYNLLAREEEREMIPLCLAEGVGTIIWSPLARGRLARAWDDAESTTRSVTDGAYADLLYSPELESSNRAIVDAVGQAASAHGMNRAQIALAWLRRQLVVTAPLVGAASIEQINEAVASLAVELTDDELRALQAPYAPRHDWQGVSDEAEMEAIRKRVPGMALS